MTQGTSPEQGGAKDEHGECPGVSLLAQPQPGPWTKPKVSAPMATVSTTEPRMSGMRVTALSRESGTSRMAATRARTPMGMFTRNTQRQDALTSRPPTTGPAAAARAPTAAHTRTARTRSSGGVAASSSPRLVGVSAAAPAACSTRAATSHHKPVPTAHAALAAVKIANPARKPALRPKRSANRPNGTSRAAYTMA